MNKDNFPWHEWELLTNRQVRSISPVDARAILANSRAIELPSGLVRAIAKQAQYTTDTSTMTRQQILQLAKDSYF